MFYTLFVYIRTLLLFIHFLSLPHSMLILFFFFSLIFIDFWCYLKSSTSTVLHMKIEREKKRERKRISKISYQPFGQIGWFEQKPERWIVLVMLWITADCNVYIVIFSRHSFHRGKSKQNAIAELVRHHGKGSMHNMICFNNNEKRNTRNKQQQKNINVCTNIDKNNGEMYRFIYCALINRFHHKDNHRFI